MAMTGRGCVLGMAPEILTGETYNEKVDVFSYAMVLVELISCKLPVRSRFCFACLCCGFTF